MRAVSVLPFAAAVSAQAVGNPWDQCGGQGWSGPKSCVNGYTCTTYNPWYAQCVPGATTAPQTTPTPTPSTTFRTSTISSVTTSPTDEITPSCASHEDVPITATTSTSGGSPSSPTPTTLLPSWYWIRAVVTPNYHSYLQAAPSATSTPVPAAIAASTHAGQFQITDGQLLYNQFSSSPLYMHVENPTDKTQRKLKTWFSKEKNNYGTFGWQGDTLTWSVDEIKRPNLAAWLVCTGQELFINTGAYLYQTPEGCFDHTIHYYNGAKPDV